MKKKVYVMVTNPLDWRYVGKMCSDQGCWYVYENTQSGAVMNVWSTQGAPRLAPGGST